MSQYTSFDRVGVPTPKFLAAEIQSNYKHVKRDFPVCPKQRIIAAKRKQQVSQIRSQAAALNDVEGAVIGYWIDLIGYPALRDISRAIGWSKSPTSSVNAACTEHAKKAGLL